MGHSATGEHPSHTLVSFLSVFFMDSRLPILASMSAILTSARARISALVVRRDTRSDNTCPLSENSLNPGPQYGVKPYFQTRGRS